MKLSNALKQVINSIKDYVDRVMPKKLSDLEIDMELGAIKTVVLTDGIIRPWEYETGVYKFTTSTTYFMIKGISGSFDGFTESTDEFLANNNVLLSITHTKSGVTEHWYYSKLASMYGFAYEQYRCIVKDNKTSTWSTSKISGMPNPKRSTGTAGKIIRIGNDGVTYELSEDVSSINGKTGDVIITSEDIEDVYSQSEVDTFLESAKEYTKTSLEESKSYTNTAVANLVNSAPETLDTLGELATAFEENAEVVEALDTAITNKADKEHNHSWNQLENRPFYEENTKVVLIPETTNSSHSINGAILYDNTALDWTLGNKVYVVFDGIKCEATCILNNDGYYEYRFYVDENSYIGFWENGAIYEYGTASDFSIGVEHTFEVYTGDIVIEQLDEKFIPDTIARVADADILSKEEMIALLTETGFISPATTASGDICINSNGDVYVM